MTILDKVLMMFGLYTPKPVVKNEAHNHTTKRRTPDPTVSDPNRYRSIGVSRRTAVPAIVAIKPDYFASHNLIKEPVGDDNFEADESLTGSVPDTKYERYQTPPIYNREGEPEDM